MFKNNPTERQRSKQTEKKLRGNNAGNRRKPQRNLN